MHRLATDADLSCYCCGDRDIRFRAANRPGDRNLYVHCDDSQRPLCHDCHTQVVEGYHPRHAHAGNFDGGGQVRKPSRTSEPGSSWDNAVRRMEGG